MLTWWVENSMSKVFRDAVIPNRPQREILLKCARNESEDAQIVLSTDSKIRRLTVELSSLKGQSTGMKRGSTISTKQIHCYFVGYVPVSYNTYNTDEKELIRKAPDLFPDPFLEEDKISLLPNLAQPIWLTVKVPENTSPGEYRGKVKIIADNKTIEVPITLQVLPFTLPVKSHLYLTKWFNEDKLVDYYGLERFSQQYWKFVDMAAKNMSEHRQNVILTPLFLLVKIIKDGQSFRYDYTNLDRWISIFDRYGIAELIEGSHLGGRIGGNWEGGFAYNSFKIYFPSGQETTLPQVAVPNLEREKILEHFLHNLKSHLQNKGWFQRLIIHQADEPIPANEESYKKLAEFVKRTLPEVKRIDAVMSKGVEGCVEIRVPQIQEIDDNFSIRPKNEELWFYTCLGPQGPYPNRFIDFSSLKVRIMHWLNWRYRATGYLHWGYCYYGQWGEGAPPMKIDPWQNTTGGGEFLPEGKLKLPPGDTFVVYPGKKKLCNSIRWEMVRKGMEDYEYLWWLENKINETKKESEVVEQGKKLLEHIRTNLLKSHSEYTRDESSLLQAKESLADIITKF
ncbi:MAG: hypothetical protein DDT40_01390 [candidate division WS2 bacterium]|nr:hypothetical protein [Candidatus Psychracetigena formicireducens]